MPGSGNPHRISAGLGRLTQVNEVSLVSRHSGSRGGTATQQVEGKMSLAKLLAVIDGGSGSEAALIAALNLGRRFSAQVELLHVEIDADSAVPMVGEGMSGAAVEQLVQSLRAEAEQRRERARGLYEKHCVAAGLNVVDADFVTAPGTFAVCFRHLVDREINQVLHFGRLSDLIVMARPDAEEEGGLSATFDAALFDSGRPVLLVPTTPTRGLGSTIAIAWDRSREATRAVGAALGDTSRGDFASRTWATVGGWATSSARSSTSASARRKGRGRRAAARTSSTSSRSRSGRPRGVGRSTSPYRSWRRARRAMGPG